MVASNDVIVMRRRPRALHRMVECQRLTSSVFEGDLPAVGGYMTTLLGLSDAILSMLLHDYVRLCDGTGMGDPRRLVSPALFCVDTHVVVSRACLH